MKEKRKNLKKKLKLGDLAILKKAKDFPESGGSLTAVKFYNRLLIECQDKIMLVLKVANGGRAVVVLINGYRKVIDSKFLKMINNKDSEELHEFKKI